MSIEKKNTKKKIVRSILLMLLFVSLGVYFSMISEEKRGLNKTLSNIKQENVSLNRELEYNKVVEDRVSKENKDILKIIKHSNPTFDIDKLYTTVSMDVLKDLPRDNNTLYSWDKYEHGSFLMIRNTSNVYTFLKLLEKDMRVVFNGETYIVDKSLTPTENKPITVEDLIDEKYPLVIKASSETDTPLAVFFNKE